MKYINWIKLLSVLLCAVMLLTACASTAEDPLDGADTSTDQVTDTEASTDENQDQVHEPVEPVLKNFFVYSPTSTWKDLGEATRMEGTCVDKTDDLGLIVMRNAEVDLMNKVTETFTVYNTVKGEVVLTVKNNYKHGMYDVFDWDNIYVSDTEIKYPESVMEVSIEKGGWGYMGAQPTQWIEVRRATITPIDEDVIEENEGNCYTIKTSYEYYDIAGNKITTSADEVYPYPYYDTFGQNLSVMFGSVNALFDLETGEVICVTSGDKEIARFGYTAENETYGYYLKQSQPSAFGRHREFLEVYIKEDYSCVLRYYVEECDLYQAAMLQNGNILLQVINEVDPDSGMAYDFSSRGMYYAVTTYIIKVPTGEATEVELNYLIQGVVSNEELANVINQNEYGIKPTENVVNFCVGVYFGDGHLDLNMDVMDIVVLNNDASVMFELDRIVPEHKIAFLSDNPFGFIVLPSGDYLVDLHDIVANRAIVSADGKVRAYLQEGAKIVGEFVVQEDGVYDYDLNRLYVFEDNDYQLATTIGDKIIVSREVEDPEDPDTFSTVYFELYKQDGAFVVSTLFDGAEVVIQTTERDYFIIWNEETEKYSMYDATLTHILTTENEMFVALCEDRYIVYTGLYVDEEHIELFYTIGE